MRHFPRTAMKAIAISALIGWLTFANANADAAEALTAPTTAIDILLQPDATMLGRAEAVNASHRKVFPQGFALDAAHRPHVTVLQRFVRTAELNQLYSVVQNVLSGYNLTGMKLEAFKYYYIPAGPLGLAGIVVEELVLALCL